MRQDGLSFVWECSSRDGWNRGGDDFSRHSNKRNALHASQTSSTSCTFDNRGGSPSGSMGGSKPRRLECFSSDNLSEEQGGSAGNGHTEN